MLRERTAKPLIIQLAVSLQVKASLWSPQSVIQSSAMSRVYLVLFFILVLYDWNNIFFVVYILICLRCVYVHWIIIFGFIRLIQYIFLIFNFLGHAWNQLYYGTCVIGSERSRALCSVLVVSEEHYMKLKKNFMDFFYQLLYISFLWSPFLVCKILQVMYTCIYTYIYTVKPRIARTIRSRKSARLETPVFLRGFLI